MWNSALHKLTEEILTEILRSNSKYDESFRTAFIEDTELVQFLASIEKNTTHEQSSWTVWSGIVASFMVIANLLDKNQSHYVKDIVVKTPEWEPFKTSLLAESNFNNNQPLAGHTTNR